MAEQGAHASPPVPARHAALLIGAATLLLVFQVYVSLSFGLILRPMSDELGMTPGVASTVSAIFMAASFLLQLPAGIAVDRYRPGRVLALATLVCAAGSLVLAAAPSVPIAMVGRLAMGLGGAFAFVGALKIVGIVVRPERFVLWVGIWQILYSLVVAGLAYLTNAIGAEIHWRALMVVIAVAGSATAALLWATDRWIPGNDAAASGTDNGLSVWRQVRATAANRQTLLAAILFALTFGPILAYSDLWAVPSQIAIGNPPAMAAALAGMIPIGLGVGSLIVGILAERTARPALIGAGTATIGLAATAGLLYLPVLPFWVASVLALLFGVGCAASVTAIAHARRTAIAGIGTAIGFVAAMGNLGGAGLQIQIGVMVGALEQKGIDKPTVFTESLSPLLLCFALAIVLMATLREPPSGRVDSAATRP